MITDCHNLWPQIVSRPAGHFDGRLMPYRWSLPSWWSRCCCCYTTTRQPHLRHPKCAAWSPYIFILLTTTLITVHEVSKRFKKWPVPVPKSPGAAADCYHEQRWCCLSLPLKLRELTLVVRRYCDLVYDVMLLAGPLGRSWHWWSAEAEEVLTFWRAQVFWPSVCRDLYFIPYLRQ